MNEYTIRDEQVRTAVDLARMSFAPGGKLPQVEGLAGIQPRNLLDVAVRFVRGRRPSLRFSGRSSRIFVRPGKTLESSELITKKRVKLGKILNVPLGVAQLLFGQGPLQPVRELRFLVQLDPEHRPDEFRITHLERIARERARDLSIENSGQGYPRVPFENRHVLLAGMEDLCDLGIAKERPQRFDVGNGKRVEDARFPGDAKLDQAQLREIGALPDEFRVNRTERLRPGTTAELADVVAVG